jgi:hypothetical protein
MSASHQPVAAPPRGLLDRLRTAVSPTAGARRNAAEALTALQRSAQDRRAAEQQRTRPTPSGERRAVPPAQRRGD